MVDETMIIVEQVSAEIQRVAVNTSGQAPGMAPKLPAVLHGDVSGIVVENNQSSCRIF